MYLKAYRQGNKKNRLNSYISENNLWRLLFFVLKLYSKVELYYKINIIFCPIYFQQYRDIFHCLISTAQYNLNSALGTQNSTLHLMTASLEQCSVLQEFIECILQTVIDCFVSSIISNARNPNNIF